MSKGVFQRYFRVCLVTMLLFPAIPAWSDTWNYSGFVRIDTVLGVSNPGPVLYAPENEVALRPGFLDTLNLASSGGVVVRNGERGMWYRFELSNPFAKNLPITFRLNQPVSQANFRWKKNAEQPGEFQIRELNRFHYVDVDLPPGRSQFDVLLRSTTVKGYSYIDIIRPGDEANDRMEYLYRIASPLLILSAFMFLLLFQICYILLQIYYNRTPEYFNYLFYLLCVALYFFNRLDYFLMSDIVQQYFTPFAHYLNDFMLLAPFIFYLRFSRYFIDTKLKYPKMDVVIKRIEWIVIVMLFVMSLALFEEMVYVANVITIVSVQLLFLCSIWMIRFFYRQRDRIVNFLLAASLCAVTGHFLAISLPMVPWFSSNIHFDYSIFTVIGLTFEIFFFNSGLGYKAKYEQQEKLKAQDMMIQEYEKSQHYLNQIETMRGRIADDLHDDVGSTLSSIVVYAGIGLNGDEKTRESILKRIIDSSQRMMESMSDIVWAIHSKNDSLSDLTDRMEDFAGERLMGLEMEFDLEKDSMVDQLHLTMKARRNLLMLFKEGINNAAKYSLATKIRCSIAASTDSVTMIIADNGVGFDIKHAKSGNGLKSMNNRTEELKGKFSVDSIPDSGTRLTFIVPIVNLIN